MNVIISYISCLNLYTNEKLIINIVLSKLPFNINYYKYNRKNNIIYIKCHKYCTNIFKDRNDINFKKSILEYKQPLIFSNDSYISICENYHQIKNKLNLNLYVCVNYADIIIDLENKNYIINLIYFNIRKPTYDKYKLFENIINNIDNPFSYFICKYDLNYINKIYSDIDNNIYDLNNIKLVFISNNNIDIDVIMPTTFTLSRDIDTKPLVSNQIKIKKIIDNF